MATVFPPSWDCRPTTPTSSGRKFFSQVWGTIASRWHAATRPHHFNVDRPSASSASLESPTAPGKSRAAASPNRRGPNCYDGGKVHLQMDPSRPEHTQIRLVCYFLGYHPHQVPPIYQPELTAHAIVALLSANDRYGFSDLGTRFSSCLAGLSKSGQSLCRPVAGRHSSRPRWSHLNARLISTFLPTVEMTGGPMGDSTTEPADLPIPAFYGPSQRRCERSCMPSPLPRRRRPRMPGRLSTTDAQLKLRFCPSMISDGFGRRSRGRRRSSGLGHPVDQGRLRERACHSERLLQQRTTEPSALPSSFSTDMLANAESSVISVNYPARLG